MGKITLLMFGCALLILIGRTEGYLYKDTASLMFGGFLGIGFFITGPFWLGMKLFKGSQGIERRMDMAIFNESDSRMLVDYIDLRANESVVSNNNEWLKKAWHSMNDLEKQEWVKLRMNYLKTLLPPSDVAGSAFFITALQNADKEYQRKGVSVTS